MAGAAAPEILGPADLGSAARPALTPAPADGSAVRPMQAHPWALACIRRSRGYEALSLVVPSMSISWTGGGLGPDPGAVDRPGDGADGVLPEDHAREVLGPVAVAHLGGRA
jgi:hypothetical protein